MPRRLIYILILAFFAILQTACMCSADKLYHAANAFQRAVGPRYLRSVEQDSTLNAESRERKRQVLKRFQEALNKWAKANK